MAYVAFVYEQWFDMEEHEDYDGYEGFSYLNVVEIGGYDEYDEYDEDDFESVGEVLVGFNEGEGTVLDVVEGDDFKSYDVELYYPPL